MAQFSSDQGKPPAQFRPSVGNVGAKMAAQALRPKGSGTAPQKKSSASKGQGLGSSRLGHPAYGQKETAPKQPQDNGHLELVGQHFNMKGLGRDVPFGVWAGLTGNYRRLAEPGRPSFDIFED